jgi:threonine/homoserine/homoserine lactone efflux protein
MTKALTIIGMIVSCLVVILFGADLAVGFPFQKASMLMDGLYLACAFMLGYMSWVSFREQK